MMELYLRPLFQRLLADPCARLLENFHPNTITLASLIFGIASAIALVCHFPLLAVALLLMSGFADVLDGSVARRRNQSSSVGAVLDIFSDRVVEVAIMLALFAVAPESRAWLVMMMISATFLCVTAFLVVGIFVQNDSQKSFFYHRGLIERPEAFVFFILMMMLPQYFFLLSISYSGLVLLSALQHLLSFRKFAL